jgi:hypothetical protein
MVMPRRALTERIFSPSCSKYEFMDEDLKIERAAALAMRGDDCEDFFFFWDEERRDIPCEQV